MAKKNPYPDKQAITYGAQRRGPHMHAKSLTGKDPVIHHSHHQANMDHGTPQGFAPPEEYQDGGCDHHLGDNVAYED